jgi:hypothetical protein
MWASEAINSGLLHDIIVDSNHMIEYLKYAATRQLFTRQGKEKSTSSRLSSVSIFNSPFSTTHPLIEHGRHPSRKS